MAGVRQFDEDEVFEEALAVFWQKGYAATTMQDLAAATGVQRGSLYNAYGDKETLFLHVFGRYRDSYLTQLRHALEQEDPRLALRQFLHYIFRSMRTGKPSRGCLSTKTALSEEGKEEQIRAVIRGLLDDMEAVLLERFDRPDTRSQLSMTPREAARMVVCMTRGLVVLERVYQDEKRLKEMAEILIGTLLPGEGSRK